MKFLIKLIVILFVLTSFRGQDFSEEDISLNSAQEGLSKQNACEVLTMEKIANLMDVEPSTLTQEDMSFGSKRSICYYFNKEGNRKMFVKLAWKSDKANDNKILESQYANYLAKGEREIKEYKEISGVGDTQILFGIGQDHEGKFLHIMRKRFGSRAELQLEITHEFKHEHLEKELLVVVNGIK